MMREMSSPIVHGADDAVVSMHAPVIGRGLSLLSPISRCPYLFPVLLCRYPVAGTGFQVTAYLVQKTGTGSG
jgi:hypothetical protein